MRLYEKIIKDINVYCIKNHVSQVPADTVKYPFYKNDKIRAAYIFLKAKDIVRLIADQSGHVIFVERLDPCISYFEDRHKEHVDYFKKLTISKVSDIVISALTATATYFIMPWLLSLFK